MNHFKELLEAKEPAPDLDKLYNNIKNAHDNMDTIIGGVNYRDLDEVSVEAGIIFYALNANGKKVTMRPKSGHRAKEVMIAGKEYLVTNKLSYSGKKYISEVMFARKPKSMNEAKKREDLEGVKADKMMRALEKNKDIKTSEHVDYDGYQVDTIIDSKTGDFYLVFHEYHNEGVMRIIKNPNSKDMKSFEDSFEAS